MNIKCSDCKASTRFHALISLTPSEIAAISAVLPITASGNSNVNSLYFRHADSSTKPCQKH